MVNKKTRFYSEKCWKNGKIFDKQFKPHVDKVVKINNDSAVKLAVESNLGIAVKSRYIVNNSDLIAELKVEGFPQVREVCLVHQKKKMLTAKAKAFIDFVKAYLKKHKNF